MRPFHVLILQDAHKYVMTIKQGHSSFLPDELTDLENPQTDIPRIAKDEIC